MTEIKLRDYQREAINAVFAAWKGGMRRPAIVLPTGAGKTVVFSALVREWRQYKVHRTGWGEPKGQRVMILAHRDELVDQAIAKLRAVMPGVNVGKVKADKNEIHADVMVCSVQTLVSLRRLKRLSGWSQDEYGKVGLIITDECHHAAAASYRKIYDAFPDALQLGVTATMARGDGVGLGSVWEDVVYRRSILWMISKGYLTDVRTVRVDLKELDMSAIPSTKTDWRPGDLGRALMEAEADTAIARAYKEHAGDRQGIVFTPTVDTAWATVDAMDRIGIVSEAVTGDTTAEERRGLYEDYRRGRIRVLVSCMVLTEGFDMPQAEVAVIARPTRSEPLYTQMVGRVLRPWPGKESALVLDLVGASATRLRTLIDLEPGAVQSVRDGESLAEAVVREAEEANAVVPAGSVAFELRARDVESFGTGNMPWIRTPAGVMFVSCGNRTRVLLWPVKGEPGLWNVCVSVEGKALQRTEYGSLPVGEAMAWAEAVAEDWSTAAYGTGKAAAWRRKRPSEKQLDVARLAKAAVTPAMNAGQVADAIERAIVAGMFDKYAVKG